jgi:hypothetical protein
MQAIVYYEGVGAGVSGILWELFVDLDGSYKIIHLVMHQQGTRLFCVLFSIFILIFRKLKMKQVKE